LSEAAQSDGLGRLRAFAPEQIATTTQFFMDLIFKPMMIRALFGEKLKSLRAEIGPHVAPPRRFLSCCVPTRRLRLSIIGRHIEHDVQTKSCR